jgi:hypothetical protein
MLASLLFIATACKSVQAEIEADLWSHEQLPEKICSSNPDLFNFGLFRKVNCTPDKPKNICPDGAETYEEFISYCHVAVKDHLAMRQADYQEHLLTLRNYEKNFCRKD